MEVDESSGGHARSGPDLRRQLAPIGRHFKLILAVVLVAVSLSTWLTSRQQPTYRAGATALLRTSQTAPLFPFGAAGRFELLRTLETEQLYVDSEVFRAALSGQVPVGTSLTVKSEGIGSLRFSVVSKSARDAAVAATAWAEGYVALRHESVRSENEAALTFVQETLDDLDGERNTLRRDVIALESVIDRTEDPDLYARLLSQKVSIETQLQTQLAPIDQQIRDLNSQLANLDLVERVLEDPEISARVDRDAAVPTSPATPDKARNAITATLLGLALGVGAAYLLTALNNRAEGREAVERATGAPVLGVIPRYRLTGDRHIEVIANPSSAVSERYRSIITAIEFASVLRPISSLLITSAHAGEGKTTTALNLAVLSARHVSVLLIDADMRRPRLDTFLGVSLEDGLSEVLAGDADFDDVMARVELDQGSFDLLSSGHVVGDPTQLLRGDTWGSLLSKLEARYDLVILDGAPVLPVTDSLLVGRSVSAQMLVSGAGKATLDDLREAAALLRGTGTRFLGVAINADRSRQASSYGYASDREK